MSKGRESKLKDFYAVRQSPPTSTPPSTPGLRISLSKPFQGFKRLQLTSRCQWIFTTRDYLSNLFTPSVSHTCTLTIWCEMKNTTINLSLRVDIQIIAQWWFNKWWFTKWKLNICCVHLFMLAWVTKNELVLSLYSLNSKTSRYALFGHNQLAIYESGKPLLCYR